MLGLKLIHVSKRGTIFSLMTVTRCAIAHVLLIWWKMQQSETFHPVGAKWVFISKRCPHWLKGLRRLQIGMVIQDKHIFKHLDDTYLSSQINTLRSRQNVRHFADDAFKRIFLNENVRISIKFSLQVFPKGPINNISLMVKIMAWRRPGDKPLSEPMMVRSPAHICVVRPKWVKAPDILSQRHWPSYVVS